MSSRLYACKMASLGREGDVTKDVQVWRKSGMGAVGAEDEERRHVFPTRGDRSRRPVGPSSPSGNSVVDPLQLTGLCNLVAYVATVTFNDDDVERVASADPQILLAIAASVGLGSSFSLKSISIINSTTRRKVDRTLAFWHFLLLRRL